MRLPVVAMIAAASLASACASSGSGGPAPTTPGSGPSVVDGITIPPIYEPPSATVVPGPATCPATLAATLDASTSRGSFRLRSEHISHLLTCSYVDARAAPGDCTKATVRVNTQPQAFQAFDRWNVETGQNSMWSRNPKLQPVPVMGIGIEGEWVPALHELGAANATTWVSVFVTCPGGPRAGLPLAKTLARQALAAAA